MNPKVKDHTKKNSLKIYKQLLSHLFVTSDSLGSLSFIHMLHFDKNEAKHETIAFSSKRREKKKKDIQNSFQSRHCDIDNCADCVVYQKWMRSHCQQC